MITKQTIARLVSEDPQPFAGVRPAYLGDAPARPASVLMLFADGPQGLEVLLTKRARHLRIHAGQVSFPGGKPEANDDSPAGTALREAEEETGLLADLVTIQGYLPPVLTNTNYMVDLTIGFCSQPVRKSANYCGLPRKKLKMRGFSQPIRWFSLSSLNSIL